MTKHSLALPVFTTTINTYKNYSRDFDIWDNFRIDLLFELFLKRLTSFHSYVVLEDFYLEMLSSNETNRNKTEAVRECFLANKAFINVDTYPVGE